MPGEVVVDVSVTGVSSVVTDGNVCAPTVTVLTSVPAVTVEVVTVVVTEPSALMVWAVVTVFVGVLVVVVVVVSPAAGPGVVVVVTTGGPTVTTGGGGGGGGLPVDDVDDELVAGVSGTVVSEMGSLRTVTTVRTVPVVTIEVVTVFVTEPSGLMACVVVTVVVAVFVVVTVVTVRPNVVVVVVTTGGPTVTVGGGGGGGGLPVDDVEELVVTGFRVLVVDGSLCAPMETTLATFPAITVVEVTTVLIVPLGAGTCDVTTVVVGVFVVVVVTVLSPDRVVVVVTTGAPTVTTPGDDKAEVEDVSAEADELVLV